MKEVPIVIKGLNCIIPKNTIENYLISRIEKDVREFDRRTQKMVYRGVTNIDYPLYNKVDKDNISIGISAIMFLKKHNPDLKFKIIDFFPKERKIFDREIEIPEGILNAPKFKVKTSKGELSRFYFFEALEACKASSNGLVSLCTGSGKSEIEITLAYNQALIFGRQLIIVPTISIKEQMIKRAESYNIKIIDYRDATSMIDNDFSLETIPNIIIGVPNSILNDVQNKVYKDLIESFKCVIVDEAHHSTCDTWSSLFLSFSSVYRIHGFSALPVTEKTRNAKAFYDMQDKDGINISVCGDVIYKKSSKELKDFINIPILLNFKYKWDNYSEKILNNIDWNQVYSYLMSNNERNKMIMSILDLLNEFKYNSISYVNRKAQGINLLKESESDENLCWFSGEFWMKDSNLYGNEIQKFSDKKYTGEMLREDFGKNKRCILMSSHGIEGLDFSNPLNALVYTEGKSERQGIQKVGRIVRPSEKQSIVINFWDTNQKILNNQAKQRASNIIEEFDCEVLEVSSLSQLREVLNKLMLKS